MDLRPDKKRRKKIPFNINNNKNGTFSNMDEGKKPTVQIPI